MIMRRLGCPEWFVRLHSKTNQFEVKSRDHGIKATIDNQLATGATDTTFRNTFWNSCILYTFLRTEKAKSCRALLLGDDMLARILGLRRHAAKRYAGIALEARMVATVARYKSLVQCSFLSKSFVPRFATYPVVVPLLGKALGRFNTRANRNPAVTDAAYFAAKSLGYAYEFRFVPSLRDVFFDRFLFEAPVALAEKHKLRLVEGSDVLTWSAREAGVTLTNVREKLIVEESWSCGDSDFNEFCLFRYGCMAVEMISAFEDIILQPSVTDFADYDGALLTALVRDFL
jgi:hypothetical protein